LRPDDVNPRCDVSRLVRAARAIDPRGDVEVPFLIDCHPVAAASASEVVDRALAAESAVARQIECPNLAIAADDGATVDEIQRLFVGAQRDAVGTLDFRLRERDRDALIRSDAIYRIVRQLHRRTIAVT